MEQSSEGPGPRFPGQEALGREASRHDAFRESASPAVDLRDAPVETPSLQAALRRARVESAERSEAVGELRSAEHGRLDLLRERLIPVLAEVPDDCDLFDLGLTPGEHPRLFIDMIGFVEMARDRRSYRFVQDTRHGRVVIAESAGLEAMTRMVADYVARRLVEREKALAADALYRTGGQVGPSAFAHHDFGAPDHVSHVQPQAAAPAPRDAAARAMRAVGSAQPPRARPPGLRVFARAFMFLIEALGSAAFFALLAAAGYWAWLRFFTH